MAGRTIDVVVLTWNDGDMLLRAARSATESEGVAVNLVIVDNGSTSPLPPLEASTHVIRNEVNRGVAAGRNQGIAMGTQEYVCVLDSDAELEPGSLARMVDVMESEPDVGLVGPVFTGQAPEASAGRAPSITIKLQRLLNIRSTYEPTATSADHWDVDFCIGACQVFRRSAWEQVGGIDESYFYGPEDVDFCLRLREAGWRVVQVRDAPVHHPPRRRFRGLLTRRGLQHSFAVARHLWRHRAFHPGTTGPA